MLLRHTLATLSCRLGKILRDTPESFAAYPEGDGQTAGKVLAHIGDLMDAKGDDVSQAFEDDVPGHLRHYPRFSSRTRTDPK